MSFVIEKNDPLTKSKEKKSYFLTHVNWYLRVFYRFTMFSLEVWLRSSFHPIYEFTLTANIVTVSVFMSAMHYLDIFSFTTV